MTDQELKLAFSHQAAHIAVATMLGCGVRTVSPTGSIAEEDWGILEAAIEDISTVCAAGFSMERLLGEPVEDAWTRSKNDRSLLAAIYADRTGIAVDEEELAEFFQRGAASAHSLLQHINMRVLIDVLAAALAEAHFQGRSNLPGGEVRTLVKDFWDQSLRGHSEPLISRT